MRASIFTIFLMSLLGCGGATTQTNAAPVDVAGLGASEAPRYDGPAPDGVERLHAPVTEAQPVRGPDDALVTIVVFSDFQCPFCSRVIPTLDRVVEEFGRDVRIAWRNNPLPFHQEAEPAAALAMEAFAQRGAAGFWAAHDLIFENQRALSRADLERYGQQLGLDAVGVHAALDGSHGEQIEADKALAAQLGLRGTPGFLINGETLMGARPYERFEEAINRAKAAARFVMDRGVPRQGVYAALMTHASDRAVDAEERRDPAPAAPRQQPDPSAVYRVPINGSVPSRGPADALVTLVLFSDFECPFCSRVEPTIDGLLTRYGQDLRVVWMNNPLPFHQQAMPAAIAAHEAFVQGDDRAFWQMHQRLFANHRALARADLERFATEVGLDMTRFRSALDGNTHRPLIEAQQQLASSLGARGTPSSFINGRNLRGAQPEAAFVTVIDEELARARAAIAAGKRRGPGLYDALIRNGATSPQTIGAPPSAAAPSRPAAPPADHDYGIPVPPSAPARGAASPQITIQIFSDFQCPFCNRVRPTLEQVVQRYGSRVRVIWRDYPLPFHQNAHAAAQAAREVFAQAGDAGFWQYHDLLFDNQRSLDQATLVRLAGQVSGVAAARVEMALQAGTHRAAVEADMAAITTAGARIGTPSFFINGRLLQGAQPFAAFEAAIDRELAR